MCRSKFSPSRQLSWILMIWSKRWCSKLHHSGGRRIAQRTPHRVNETRLWSSQKALGQDVRDSKMTYRIDLTKTGKARCTRLSIIGFRRQRWFRATWQVLLTTQSAHIKQLRKVEPCPIWALKDIWEIKTCTALSNRDLPTIVPKIKVTWWRKE